MLERSFLFFWIFLPIFFRNFLSGVKHERNSGLKFFFLFFGLSHPVLAKNNVGKRFLNFLIFFYFSWNFLARIEYEWNSGLKFFSLYLGLSHPVSAKNIAGKRFFNFFNFIAIFFAIFFPGPSMNGIRDKNFFSLFLGLSHPPFWLNIMPERGFLIFWFFLQFLSELSCPGQVWMEFGTKIVFSLSRPISSRFG